MQELYTKQTETGTGYYIPYQEFVKNLFKVEGFNPLAHAAMGVSGEAGELLDAIKKHVIYNKPLDRENVVEELGDLFFYMTALMQQLDISDQEVVDCNVTKLSKRYSSGYSDQAAIARADKIATDPEVKYFVFLSDAKRLAKQYTVEVHSEEEARLLVLSFKNSETSALNPQGYSYPFACWEAVSADGFAEYMQE